jgi:TorA maturation chaperone TorD
MPGQIILFHPITGTSLLTSTSEIAEEQEWRAATYHLLANLLQAPPENTILRILGNLTPENFDRSGGPIVQAWKQLAIAARGTDPELIRKEFHELFIGMTRGEILPYASWYLTGFLMEKPLAEIRKDLVSIGIKRHDNVREPEDHIAALFEVMTLLIRRNDDRQSLFFNRHIATWAQRLFSDIAKSNRADFYRSVACLAAEFVILEQLLFELAQE